jgi:hypothetical protein
MTLRSWIPGLALLLLAGCGKNIGDSCESVNECISTDTDRLCLTQDGEGFPGGYCTKFNCGGSNACPEEATCVAYRSTLGGGGCDSESSISRLQRNYCMLRCENDSDCRSGYRCLAADGDNPLGALIIDNHVGAKICTLSYDEPKDAPPRDSDVCQAVGLRGDAGSSSVSRDASGSGETEDGGDATGDAAASLPSGNTAVARDAATDADSVDSAATASEPADAASAVSQTSSELSSVTEPSLSSGSEPQRDAAVDAAAQ